MSSLLSIKKVYLVTSNFKVDKIFYKNDLPFSHAHANHLAAGEDDRTNNLLRDLVTYRGQRHGPEDDHQALLGPSCLHMSAEPRHLLSVKSRLMGM